jgi:hypothetical protein
MASKTIHYRHAKLIGESKTLQQLLCETLAIPDLKIATNRKEKPNSDEESYRLLNYSTAAQQMFFAQFIYVRPGESQPILTEDPNAESYNIDALLSKSISGKDAQQGKKEFINSILYFGVLDNHLIVLPSPALSIRDLEIYLAWLIGTKAGLFGKTARLILQNQPPKDTIEKFEKSPVKNIVIGAPLVSAAPKKIDEKNIEKSEAIITNTKMINVDYESIGFSLLKSILPQNIFKNSLLKDSLDESNLKVRLVITYDRKTDAKGQFAIDSIATAVRHMDDADVSITLKNGGKIQGSELKLSSKISVKLTHNGLIDETDLFTKMRDWLLKQIECDNVEC